MDGGSIKSGSNIWHFSRHQILDWSKWAKKRGRRRRRRRAEERRRHACYTHLHPTHRTHTTPAAYTHARHSGRRRRCVLRLMKADGASHAVRNVAVTCAYLDGGVWLARTARASSAISCCRARHNISSGAARETRTRCAARPLRMYGRRQQTCSLAIHEQNVSLSSCNNKIKASRGRTVVAGNRITTLLLSSLAKCWMANTAVACDVATLLASAAGVYGRRREERGAMLSGDVRRAAANGASVAIHTHHTHTLPAPAASSWDGQRGAP